MTKKVLRALGIALLSLLLLSVGAVVVFRNAPVPGTLLMQLRHWNEGTPIHYRWTPYEKISPHLAVAVMAGEDNRFLQHNGFDLVEIENARRDAQAGKRLRGASTLSQQTAKNLFLWPGRSWVRKGLEAYFTLLIEQLWSKKRIIEVYMNIAEMGDGIYGAAAVAQHHFGTTPDKLTREQCATIAATLPNPRRMNSANPSKYVLQRRDAILRNMNYLERNRYGAPTKERKGKVR